MTGGALAQATLNLGTLPTWRMELRVHDFVIPNEQYAFLALFGENMGLRFYRSGSITYLVFFDWTNSPYFVANCLLPNTNDISIRLQRVAGGAYQLQVWDHATGTPVPLSPYQAQPSPLPPHDSFNQVLTLAAYRVNSSAFTGRMAFWRLYSTNDVTPTAPGAAPAGGGLLTAWEFDGPATGDLLNSVAGQPALVLNPAGAAITYPPTPGAPPPTASYTLTAGPPPTFSAGAGGTYNATYTFTANRIGGFAEPIALTCAAPLNGCVCTQTGSPTGTTLTLNVNAPASTNTTLTVLGTGGGLPPVPVNIAVLTPAVPRSAVFAAGTFARATLNLGTLPSWRMDLRVHDFTIPNDQYAFLAMVGENIGLRLYRSGSLTYLIFFDWTNWPNFGANCLLPNTNDISIRLQRAAGGAYQLQVWDHASGTPVPLSVNQAQPSSLPPHDSFNQILTLAAYAPNHSVLNGRLAFWRLYSSNDSSSTPPSALPAANLLTAWQFEDSLLNFVANQPVAAWKELGKCLRRLSPNCLPPDYAALAKRARETAESREALK